MAFQNYCQQYSPYQNYSYIYPNNYQQTQQMYNTQQVPMLNGKIVDGIDVVKGFDLPVGSYAIFPKADSSVIYVKGWNDSGTTYIDEYEKIKPIKELKDDTTDLDFNSKLEEIYSSIKLISKKIDGIKQPQQSSSTPMKRKKVEEDE